MGIAQGGKSHDIQCYTIYCFDCMYCRVGSAEGGKSHDIQLNGTYIKEEHCTFENDDGRYTLLEIIPF